MKVLVLGKRHTEWQNGLLIYLEARFQGKNVRFLDLKSNLETIKRIINKWKPDWVFITGIRSLYIETLEEIKKLSKIFIWDADAADVLRDKIWKDRAGIPDIAVNSTIDVVKRYKNLYTKLEWCPQFMDSEYYKSDNVRLNEEEEIFDVTFLGSAAGDTLRLEWLRRLKREGFNCCIRGSKSNTDTHPGQIYGTGMVNLYLQSKIVIDIKRENFYYGEFVTSDRIYKAMGSGAFYLTFNIPSLDKLFQNGEHLAVYNNYQGMVNKIKYYLKHSEEREEIAKKGKMEIFNKHLLKHRIPQYWGLMEGIEEWPFN